MLCDFDKINSAYIDEFIDALSQSLNRYEIEDEENLKSRLKSFLFMLRGTEREKLDISTVPGFFFKYSGHNIEIDKLVLVVKKLLGVKKLVENEQILIAKILVQIASYDFLYFADNIVPLLLENREPTYIHLYLTIATAICDPITGFLINSPLSTRNYEWDNDNAKFDFFSRGSPDLDSKFGRALIKIRRTIQDLLREYIPKEINEISKTNVPTIYVPSLMFSIQTVIVPRMFKSFNMACGFPSRVEILLAISQLQYQNEFRRKKDYNNQSNESLIESWSIYYQSLTNSNVTMTKGKMDFKDMDDCSDNIIIRLLKLTLLTYFSYSDDFDPFDPALLVSFAFGNDPQLVTFMIIFCQALIAVNNDRALNLFKAIQKVFDKFTIISSQQQYTYFYILSRLLDIYVCLPGRKIEKDTIFTILTHGLVGLSSVHGPVRNASMKLIVSIGRFLEYENLLSISHFLEVEHVYLIYRFTKILELQPYLIIQKKPKRPFKLLNFNILINTSNLTLWQIMLSALSQVLAFKYNLDALEKIRDCLYNFITLSYQRDDITEHFSQDICCINATTLLSGILNQNDPIDIRDRFAKFIIMTVKTYISSYPAQIRTILHGMNNCLFESILHYIEKEDDIHVVSITLSSMAWNTGFASASQYANFLPLYVDKFIDFRKGLIKSKILRDDLGDDLLHVDKEEINSDLIKDFEITAYQLFSVLINKYTRPLRMPFPCMNFVDSQNPEIINLSELFHDLYNIIKYHKGDIQLYALKTFERYVQCCQIKDISLVYQSEFLSILLKYDNASRILTGLLQHNFEALFPHFLSLAMSPDGDPYFESICNFFTPSCYKSDVETDTLLKELIWTSTSPIIDTSGFTYLQIIYEKFGSIIVTCLYYLIRTQKYLTGPSFLVLASITPSVYLFRMKNKVGKLNSLLSLFLKICQNFNKSLHLIDLTAIEDISSMLAKNFPFLLEQVLSDTLDLLPNIPHDIQDLMIKVTIPWFKLVSFNLHDMVISPETEIQFMKFSIHSFVEKVFLSSNIRLDTDNPNASNNEIWRALCLTDSSPSANISYILYSIDCFTDPIVHVLRYIYTIVPDQVLIFLTSYLSFNYNIHTNLFLYIGEDNRQVSKQKGSSSNSAESFVFSVLSVLCKLSQDSILPVIQYLPKILVFCLLFKEVQPEKTTKLVETIFIELKPFLSSKLQQISEEIIDTFTLLPNNEDIKSSIKTEFNKLKLPLGTTKWKGVSSRFRRFFNKFDPKLQKAYSEELLKWSLCDGKLLRASIALKAFQGAIYQLDTVTIPLAARAILNVSRTLENLLKSKQGGSSQFECILYISSFLKTLLYHAKLLERDKILYSDTAIFWIAMECLKFNTLALTPIFSSSIKVLTFYFDHSSLFESLNHSASYDGTQFAEKSFWEFHQDFDGCLKYILSFTGENINIKKVFMFLNKLIQLKFPSLIMNSPLWVYTAILAILPWMWSVVIVDVARFLLKTPDVLCMQDTIDCLSTFVDDKEITNILYSFLKNNDIDMYSTVSELVSRLVTKMELNHLRYICNFYAICLASNESALVIPLYSITTSLLTVVPDPKEFVKFLGRFNNQVTKRAGMNTDIFIEHYISKLEPYRSLNIDINHLNFAASPIFSLTNTPAEELHESKASSLGPLTMFYHSSNENLMYRTSFQKSEPKFFEFPNRSLFEKIVIALAPQILKTDYHGSQTFNFNSPLEYIELFPRIPEILNIDYFKDLARKMRHIKIEPFDKIEAIKTKLNTFLVDPNTLSKMKENNQFIEIDIPYLLSEVLNNMNKKANIEYSPSYSRLYTVDQFNLDIETTDSIYQMKPIDPAVFIPSLDYINSIGYNDEEDFYDIYET